MILAHSWIIIFQVLLSKPKSLGTFRSLIPSSLSRWSGKMEVADLVSCHLFVALFGVKMDHISGHSFVFWGIHIPEGCSIEFVLDVCILPFQIFDLMLRIEKKLSLSHISAWIWGHYDLGCKYTVIVWVEDVWLYRGVNMAKIKKITNLETLIANLLM